MQPKKGANATQKGANATQKGANATQKGVNATLKGEKKNESKQKWEQKIPESTHVSVRWHTNYEKCVHTEDADNIGLHWNQ